MTHARTALWTAAAAAIAALLAGPATAAGDAATQPLVVELFTSQGCSSCPPADAHLGELAKRKDLVALTFNVDYWDYIGWKDTLASPEYTKRQYAYASAMGERRVYTPQMVVDGREHAVGSSRAGVARLIDSLRAGTGARLDVRFAKHDGHVLVQLPDGSYRGDATVWLALFDREQAVEIKRGENTGRTVTYHNVVRELRNLGLWRGQRMEIALSHEDLMAEHRDGCAVIVQQDMAGPVLGAAMMALHDGGS